MGPLKRTYWCFAAVRDLLTQFSGTVEAQERGHERAASHSCGTDRIAAETGRAPTCFAYPNSRPADYTARTQEIVRGCGFTLAFSTSEGIAGPTATGSRSAASRRAPPTSPTSPGSPRG